MGDGKPRAVVFRWRSAVFNARMTSTERLVGLTLAEFASTNGGDINPALTTIARFAGFNEKTVRTAIQSLIQTGWIERRMKGSGQEWRYSDYTLLFPEGADTTPARSHRRADTTPARSVSEGEERTPAPSAERSGHSRPNVRTLTPKGAGPTPNEQEELSGKANWKEQSDADAPFTLSESHAGKTVASKATAERFDDFWRAYPRKAGDKPGARKLWAKNKLDEQADAIIDAVAKRTAGDPRWADRQYIPHPKTYISQERWNDEWSAAPKRKPSIADSFAGKVYEGTPEDELPYFLRVAI